MKKWLMAVSAAALLASTQAKAAVITFESAPDNNGNFVQTYDGFTFSFSANGWGVFKDDFVGGGSPYTHNGTTRLVAAGGNPAQVVITRQGGGTFSVVGLDAATMFPEYTGQINVVGALLGGGSLSTTLNVSNAFQSFYLLNFSNLVSVTFSDSLNGSYRTTPGLSLDNIGLYESNSVPVPAPAALLGIGLLGLAAVRRRNQ